jgi:hypothetical protein
LNDWGKVLHTAGRALSLQRRPQTYNNLEIIIHILLSQIHLNVRLVLHLLLLLLLLLLEQHLLVEGRLLLLLLGLLLLLLLLILLVIGYALVLEKLCSFLEHLLEELLLFHVVLVAWTGLIPAHRGGSASSIFKFDLYLGLLLLLLHQVNVHISLSGLLLSHL